MVEQDIVRALERAATAFERIATALDRIATAHENGRYPVRRQGGVNGGGFGGSPRPVQNRAMAFPEPTEVEIENFCKENGLDIDTHHFWTHYHRNGWTRKNGKPLTDWQGCVRFWAENNKS